MKKIMLLLFIAVGFITPVSAQSFDAVGGGQIYDVVDTMPSYRGGPQAMAAFIEKTIRYPMQAKMDGVHGRVFVSFIVEPKGYLTNVHVARRFNEYLDAEAVRVVRKMHWWNPGKKDGKAVRTRYTIPINFVLQK